MSRGAFLPTAVAVFAVAGTLTGLPAANAQQKTPGYNHLIPRSILTPDTVETRLGTLKFFDGMPNKETVEKLYDNLDIMRGVETLLNGIPATSIEGLRRGFIEVGSERAISRTKISGLTATKAPRR